VVKIEFHGDRAVIIDEPADADVVLRPKQIGDVENIREREVVGTVDVVNGEVVA